MVGTMQPGIVVRAETPDDLRAIDVVHLSAFEGEDEANLVGALRQLPGFDRTLSLVAELNGRIVGHVLLTRIRLQRAGGDCEILALGPMSVVPSQSHRGIGVGLIEASVAAGAQQKFPAIVVVGHPEYYQRFGFSPAAQWSLECNLPVSPTAVSARELEAAALAGGGRIVYPAPFLKIF